MLLRSRGRPGGDGRAFVNREEYENQVRHPEPETPGRRDRLPLLEPEEARRIAAMFVEELRRSLETRGVRLNVDEAVVDKLAEDGFDPVYGARPLCREVECEVDNPLAVKIVRGECSEGCTVKVSVQDGAVAFDVDADTAPA